MTDCPTRPVTILIADDDPEDRFLLEEGFEEAAVNGDVRFVEDGEQLMDYLLHRGRYEGVLDAPEPGLILLDLNMPRKDGREALREIKGHLQLRRIPVVALTTSSAEEDVTRAYNDGANSFVTKPRSFDNLVELIRSINAYWLTHVELPPVNH